MVIEQNTYLFFRTVRVILDDPALAAIFKNKSHYSYITGISYSADFSLPGIVSKSKKTVVIRVTGKSDEELLGASSETTRNEIRRTLKTPELHFVLPDNNWVRIWDLYRAFEERGKRPARSKNYFTKSIVAGAYQGDVLIAAVICYNAHPYMRVHAIVSRRIEDRLRAKFVSFATRRLIFDLARYARDNGYLWLDLGGINITDESKAGITAFKMSFGGECIDEYTYTYKSSIFRYAYSFLH